MSNITLQAQGSCGYYCELVNGKIRTAVLCVAGSFTEWFKKIRQRRYIGRRLNAWCCNDKQVYKNAENITVEFAPPCRQQVLMASVKHFTFHVARLVSW